MATKILKNTIVTFTGGAIYVSSTATKATRKINKISKCKVTNINEHGKHPYHLISQDGKGVYGWVDKSSIKESGTKTEVIKPKKKVVLRKAKKPIRKTPKTSEIGTLGDIVFKVSAKKIQTFDGLKIDSKANYAKHTRHNKKPLLEFQYNDTDTANFSIYLSAFLGVNPRDMQNKIDKYMEKGKILTLVIGGEKYGSKWVIISHSKEYERFDNKGNLLVAKSNISLEEYAER